MHGDALPGRPIQMWFTGEYREVVENERLVYTESMSDENGNVVSPSDKGMPEGHPTTTEVIVVLEAVGGRTNMVMTHVGVPGDSSGATGWAMALDKLAAHVDAHSDA
ncbi:MAG TPA: SRPBCC domain-containing protein [Acidimicrobiales bacterium]|nr:SRPBCC domain-containing protein [Acidimicrobiales bacterium]